MEAERDDLSSSERALAEEAVQRDSDHQADLADLKAKVHQMFKMKSDEHRAALKVASDKHDSEKSAAQNEVHQLFRRQEEEHLREKQVTVGSPS